MLELQNIYKSYGEKIILQNFSYKFNNTGLYAISGASGIGKTTLLRLISRLESADKGHIKGPKEIAYSFQEYRLFSNLTMMQNIELVAFGKHNEDNTETVERYLSLLSLLDDKDKYPSELSGGMKQRVSLIRAFVSSSPIILLDEPTKELDTELANVVVEIIQHLSKERLIIFTVHDENFASEIGAEIIRL